MALYKARTTTITPTRKCSSIGQGGRGRRVKISMSTMNKSKKRSHKRYRGQGRQFMYDNSEKGEKQYRRVVGLIYGLYILIPLMFVFQQVI